MDEYLKALFVHTQPGPGELPGPGYISLFDGSVMPSIRS